MINSKLITKKNIRILIARMLRKFVRTYLLYFPLEKGKWRLRYILQPYLSVPGEVILTKISYGFWMELDINDFIQMSIYLGYYEQHLIDYLTSLLNPNMIMIDIGANVGLYTLLSARIVGSRGHVYAFEPDKRNFARLLKNINLNDLTNVTLNCKAIADFEGKAAFYIKSDCRNSGLNSLRKTSDEFDFVLDCEVTTIDRYLEMVGSKVDVIRIDAEGAELPILLGSKNIIAMYKPVIIFEASEKQAQAFGYSTKELKRHLTHYGYKIYHITRNGLKTEREDSITLFGDLVAIPS